MDVQANESIIWEGNDQEENAGRTEKTYVRGKWGTDDRAAWGSDAVCERRMRNDKGMGALDVRANGPSVWEGNDHRKTKMLNILRETHLRGDERSGGTGKRRRI